MSSPKRVAIIGAGPSGLTAARQAILYGFDVKVFERSSALGGAWRHDEIRERAPIPPNSATQFSKDLCAFSEFPFAPGIPTFVPSEKMLEYLQNYAKTFQLVEHVHFGVEVIQVERSKRWVEDGIWRVKYAEDGKNGTVVEGQEDFDAVLVCTGMRQKGWRPPMWRLEREFQGRIIHSEKYQGSKDYRGRNICVVGFGNSAMEIASQLASAGAKQVFLASKRGSWLLRRLKVGGRPWDVSFNSRFHFFGRRIVPKFIVNLLWEAESISTCDQLERIQPKHRLLSSHFTFGDSFPLLLASGRVKITPNILSFSATKAVEFEDRSIVKEIDDVILCTGYQFDFPFIEKGTLINMRYNDFHLYKHMFPPELGPHYNLAVIGHVQARGCRFPIAEMQSRYFFHVLSGKTGLPTVFEMKSELEWRRCEMSLNYVKSQRHTQIEDYIEYMEDVATCVGARPNLLRLLITDPLLAFHCFFGPLCAYQYRLVGLHRWSGAREAIMEANKGLQISMIKDQLREITVTVANNFFFMALFVFLPLLMWQLFW